MVVKESEVHTLYMDGSYIETFEFELIRDSSSKLFNPIAHSIALLHSTNRKISNHRRKIRNRQKIENSPSLKLPICRGVYWKIYVVCNILWKAKRNEITNQCPGNVQSPTNKLPVWKFNYAQVEYRSLGGDTLSFPSRSSPDRLLIRGVQILFVPPSPPWM